jgi:mRNA interferase RelE/StbE
LTWTIEFNRQARKDIAGLPPIEQKRVSHYLRTRVLAQEDPRSLGKPLKGPLSGAWRYRVGDIRILCRIEDEKLVVLVVGIGNRREIYR